MNLNILTILGSFVVITIEKKTYVIINLHFDLLQLLHLNFNLETSRRDYAWYEITNRMRNFTIWSNNQNCLWSSKGVWKVATICNRATDLSSSPESVVSRQWQTQVSQGNYYPFPPAVLVAIITQAFWWHTRLSWILWDWAESSSFYTPSSIFLPSSNDTQGLASCAGHEYETSLCMHELWMINSVDSFGALKCGYFVPYTCLLPPLDPVPSFHTLMYNMDFCTDTWSFINETSTNKSRSQPIYIH